MNLEPLLLQRQSRCFLFLLTLFAVCTLVATISGCANAIRRGQSPDDSFSKLSEDEKESNTDFIGDVCGIKGLLPAKLEGVGLVVGLERTGSEPAPSGQKDYLLRELKSSKSTKNAKAALRSKNTSMVMLRGMIPPAAKKGDRIDIEVVTHPKSDTTSLKYGELLKTDLRPMASISRSVKLGNVMGKAKGRVLVDSLFDSRNDEETDVKGRILGGGIVGEDRGLTLVVHSEETSVKVTRSISHSINQRFTSYTSSGRDNTAKPVTDRIIELNIPREYEHNLGRFIQAIRALAYGESAQSRIERIDSLDRRISNAATSQRAAIELESIGEEALPTLQNALKNPDFEVRFYVAEALAYMGKPDGIPHLKLAAESEPAFRWHALTALASIDSETAETALFDLFDVQSAETRYGAFRALQACCPDNKKIAGKMLANDFKFHEFPSKGTGLLHFSRTKQPEIVVFGNTERVASNFIFVEAGLTVKAINSEKVQISSFDPIEGKSQLKCSTRISDLVLALSRLGVDYSTMLEMFREADSDGTMNSRLVVNAAPKIGSKSMSESVSKTDSEERSERYIAAPAPELFSEVNESAMESK